MNNSTTAPDNWLEDAKQSIAESNAIYFQAFQKNDANLFLQRYANDACLMPPGSPVIHPETFPGFFRMAYDTVGIRDGKFFTTAVYGSGPDYVVEEGVSHLINSQGVVFDIGKYLVLWKKTAQGWKMFRDSFSGDAS